MPASFVQRRGAGRGLDRFTLAALVVLLILVLLAAAADLLAERLFGIGPYQQDLLRSYAPPELAAPTYWLGGDEFGRGQVVRLLHGARVSLGVGFGAALLNLVLGLLIGLAAGYFRGWVDEALQAIAATFATLPSLYVLLLFSVLFNPGPLTLLVVVALLSWPRIALFVRGQSLSLRERDYIAAARALGASPVRVLFRHLLPNVLPFALVLAAVDVGAVILLESALSFLGFGVQPPTPSWGGMLAYATADLSRAPWLPYAPGSAIFLTVFCLYVLADGLRDVLDPSIARSGHP